ncbi:(2Fe-2S)-binding protein [Anaerotignum propionicum]|uniref:Carbon-monoxide dehydrogenase small subunit n=1 Tax=Anaerotignum propionicum DSM 1682 TaxID=991789 RepID=A0A0X1U8E8_ANAPI|nr:(2Fe-2S)-binding protein [Anaerotignum propionicum]AMJ41240.1 nicotinate dehydrogenase subunit A [Anaerotignum propionicum DSM 1682]SHF11685.1 carbon-monoxide dehydrogenase small subunit [[Clostridium] propionicum DSM 1682] [Anaerotignum propionicum DSM 1682]
MVQYEGKTVISLQVNGETFEVAVRPSDILLDILREQLGLTSAKAGCLNGDCGACTVIVDGLPAKSCLMLAVEAEGHVILTVEGLGGLAPIQKAFVDADAFQCGYCTSGFLIVCHALKMNYPVLPEEYIIEEWLQSNLCRCTSYQEIRKAVHLMYEIQA